MEEQQRQFKGIWIPKEVWESKELTLQQKVILVEIDSLDNEEGCYASNKYFSDFFGISNGRISQIISELIDKGYLNVEYIKKDNQILGRILKIQSPPYPVKVFKKLNRGYLENDKGGIKYSKEGYLENDKDNNIDVNNINVNNNIYSPAKAEQCKEIIDYLNLKANTHYRHNIKKTQTLINARFNENFTIGDFKKVIDNKVSEWKNTDMAKYIRPETLFGTKFESYLNQKKKEVIPSWFNENIETDSTNEQNDEEFKEFIEEFRNNK